MKICLVSMSPIEDDPRVRRQGDALAGAGHEVIGVGVGGARSIPPAWPVVHRSDRQRGRLGNSLLAGRGAVGSVLPVTVSPLFWSLRHARPFLRAAVKVRADLYLANDWWVLPVAERAAALTHARYCYDTHEYAVEENAQNRVWNAVMPRFVDHIERSAISGAESVSTVAEGIASRLEERYSLPRHPEVIRNVPDYQDVDCPRELRPPYQVLYQGLFNANRRLDVLIDSVRMWRPEFRLVIRGDGSPSEIDRLAALADEAGDRVRLEPPVPMTQMVTAAASADIGIFALPASNPQAEYCLPNKLFEYLMAGLAVCVSDLPEMRSIVDQYDVGVLMSSTTPEGIATSVNALSIESLVRYQTNARTAARELNWGVEQTKLLEICRTPDGR